MADNIADDNLRNELLNRLMKPKIKETVSDIKYNDRVDSKVLEAMGYNKPIKEDKEESPAEINGRESLKKLENVPEGQPVKHVDFEYNGQWLVKSKGKVWGVVQNNGNGGRYIYKDWFIGEIDKRGESKIEGRGYSTRQEALAAIKDQVQESSKGLLEQCLEHQLAMEAEVKVTAEDRKRIFENVNYRLMGMFKKR